MDRRGFVPVVVIIVASAIVFTFVGGGLLAWQTSYLDRYLPPTVKELLGNFSSGKPILLTFPIDGTSSEDSETISEEATKDWKTYTNTELGLSFKYPSGWYVNLTILGPEKILTTSSLPETIDQSGASLGLPTGAVFVRLARIYEPNGVPSSLENYILGRFGSDAETIVNKTIGGKSWVETYVPHTGMKWLFSSGENGGFYRASFAYPSSKESLDLVELIISTIRFF